ncbi:unnamed protein product [Gordionus sp. m RMFG-2023]|uniref:programmed cell death protein 5-like n=1 Tax=Gordionus sp. m RMFG-2023 TaxID=3053472 RepID=UPI0030DF637C
MDLSLQNVSDQNLQKSENKPDYKKDEKVRENADQQEQLRNTILSSVLDQKARARLSNITLAKPDKGKALENMIIQMAQYGRIQHQLNEDQMVKLLEQLNQQQKPKTIVKFERRQIDDYSDEDY